MYFIGIENLHDVWSATHIPDWDFISSEFSPHVTNKINNDRLLITNMAQGSNGNGNHTCTVSSTPNTVMPCRSYFMTHGTTDNTTFLVGIGGNPRSSRLRTSRRSALSDMSPFFIPESVMIVD